MPPFNYGETPLNDVNKKRITRPPVELEKGVIYEGEWDEKGLRDGRGVQTWPNGSFYEGYFVDDCADIKGRLIHSDLDLYEGEWKRD